MVWDTIHGRDPARGAVEEWGGISYALSALDAALPEDWELVPLIKVGRDLAPRAGQFLAAMRRRASGARFVEVPEPNNRVTLRYLSSERRCEQMSGGVPPWTWSELGPMVDGLDALYVHFISGFELALDTARALRLAFPRRMYVDLHSLFLDKEPDGTRVLRPLPRAAEWFSCFNHVQLNEDEMRQVGSDPFAVAAAALGADCTSVCVTLGPRGAVYFTQDARGGPVRTARIPAPVADAGPADGGDPTGCGDVFGGAVMARLVAGASLEEAIAFGCRLAARNVSHRGATGLRDHLLGRLAVA